MNGAAFGYFVSLHSQNISNRFSIPRRPLCKEKPPAQGMADFLYMVTLVSENWNRLILQIASRTVLFSA